ncbi:MULTISPECIES: hypothetical protein [unclassified Streptomyces]|uniref:hypothetical protein n=1 Tax=unclassified Streptomyces TaxID=2593676 RepID=UPI0035D5746D
MQMTESYAATVAAVVPVLWLVGAVEQHQLAKNFAQRSRELEDLARRNSQVTAALADDASLADIEAAMARLEVPESDRDGRLGAITTLVWAVTAALLLPAEMSALLWLGDSSKGPSEFAATYSLVAIMLGFLAVGSIPIGVALWGDRQATKGFNDALKASREHRERVRRAFEARFQALRDRVGEARTPEDLEEIRRLLSELEGGPAERTEGS